MVNRIITAVFFMGMVVFFDGGKSCAQTFNPTSASITPACASPGTQITMRANANRSSGVYFRYVMRDFGQQDRSRLDEDYSPDNMHLWTLDGNGKKLISVQMKDDVTAGNWRGIVELSYEVGASNCIDPVAISLNPTNGRVNEPVTITVTGAQSNLYYQFWVTPGLQSPFGSAESVMVRDWSTNSRLVWTPVSQDWYTLEVRTTNDKSSSNWGEAKISYKVDLTAQRGSPSLLSHPAANPGEIFNDGNSKSVLTVEAVDPDGDLASVAIDLTPFGGSSYQPMHDDGTHGDTTAGDGIYSVQTMAPASTSVGEKALLITAKDKAGNIASNFILLPVTSRIVDTLQAQTTKTYTVLNDIPRQTITIRYGLTERSPRRGGRAEGCNVNLTVKRPNGEVYGTETISSTVGTMIITNAEAGTWTYDVANNCTTAVSYDITTSGGGVGVVTGTVKDAPTQRSLTGAQVTSDIGGIALTLSGYYVMVNAAGAFTISAASQSYEVASQPNIVLNAGGTVTADFNLTPVPVNPTAITINQSTSPGMGNPVSISFDAAGQTAPLSYRYWQASGYQTPQYGNWQLLRNWVTDTTLSWTPAADGHYVIVAYVTNDTASGGYHQVGLSVETQGNREHPIMISKLQTDLGYPQPKGRAVNLNTTATGGDQPLSYRYWEKKEPGGEWITIQNYSSESSCTWIPDESGIYIVVVWVTDDTSVAEPPIAGMTCTIGE